MYVGQIGEGDDYTVLRPAISICVLDAVMFRQSPQIQSDFRLRSRDGNLDLTDGLQIHLLELPKYTVPSDNRVIADPVEAWLYFFRRANQMTSQEIQQRFNSPAFTEAAELLDMIQRTPQQRDQYELRLKAQRDDRAKLQQARLEGKAEGKAEGEAIGEARGEARGEVRGRIELLRELLGAKPETLASLTLDQLAALESDLQSQLRERGV